MFYPWGPKGRSRVGPHFQRSSSPKCSAHCMTQETIARTSQAKPQPAEPSQINSTTSSRSFVSIPFTVVLLDLVLLDLVFLCFSTFLVPMAHIGIFVTPWLLTVVFVESFFPFLFSFLFLFLSVLLIFDQTCLPVVRHWLTTSANAIPVPIHWVFNYMQTRGNPLAVNDMQTSGKPLDFKS